MESDNSQPSCVLNYVKYNLLKNLKVDNQFVFTDADKKYLEFQNMTIKGFEIDKKLYKNFIIKNFKSPVSNTITCNIYTNIFEK